MKRGDVVLVRFPHPSGQRGKERPAVVVQSDAYASTVKTVVIAEVTKNLTMKDDPACLFIDVSTPEGKATGLLIDSVVSSLVLDTVSGDTVAQVLGSLSRSLLQRVRRVLESGTGSPLEFIPHPLLRSLIPRQGLHDLTGEGPLRVFFREGAGAEDVLPTGRPRSHPLHGRRHAARRRQPAP
jgi:mRNA interferase MazF